MAIAPVVELNKTNTPRTNEDFQFENPSYSVGPQNISHFQESQLFSVTGTYASIRNLPELSLETSLMSFNLDYLVTLPEFLISQLEEFFANGEFLKAIKMVQELKDSGTSPEAYEKYACVLSPPDITTGKTFCKDSIALNNEWVKNFANDYRGKWVALEKGELLFSGEKLNSFPEKIKNISGVFIKKIV